MRQRYLGRQFRGIVKQMRRLLRQQLGEGDMIVVLMSDSYLSARPLRIGDQESLQVYNSLPSLLTHSLIH